MVEQSLVWPQTMSLAQNGDSKRRIGVWVSRLGLTLMRLVLVAAKPPLLMVASTSAALHTCAGQPASSSSSKLLCVEGAAGKPNQDQLDATEQGMHRASVGGQRVSLGTGSSMGSEEAHRSALGSA